MTSALDSSSPAGSDRIRAWRKARREAGMVKLELWVPQATRDDVRAAVRAIVTDSTRSPALVQRRRSPTSNAITPGADHQMDAVIETAWTVPAIKAALDESSLVREGELTLRVVEGADPVLLATMHEYGDLPIYLSVGGAQIVCSVLLWPVSEQKDAARFNEFLLKAQRVVPLSNFAITSVSDEDVYELMGELSCKTTLQTILIELRTLAENAIDATSLRETFDAA
ncbi:YjfI family protein [Brevundimonas sp. NIBR10]|uniref:YjfI family protein n=1 Tax=Brevundimonas sp. NIBR10 TaxID=3015997 RepID=UPI0022F15130|nr:YjfI family protein [Brevundimonas sp. NIBR10]